MYQYFARYISNYDGDTIKFEVDLGFNVFHRITVRLIGVDFVEIKDKINQQLAIKARDWVKEKLSNAKYVKIETYKDKTDKYGRYLAEVWYIDDSTDNYKSLTLDIDQEISDCLKDGK